MTRVLIVALLAACGCGEGSIAQGRAAILDGALDDVHEAVVAYVGEAGSCTAVIFEVSGGQGYALTAAHCLTASLGVLRQGRDLEQPTAEYPVLAQSAHPLAMNAPAFDVAVLRFGGANLSTPSVPLLAPADDAFDAGDVVELVGYGLTEKGPSDTRRSVSLPLEDVTLTTMLFDQQAGGFCSGDSGGPALTTSSPARVAALLQNVLPDCRGTGMAGRLSAFHDSFIVPVVAGETPAPPSCEACFEAASFAGSACAATADRCAEDAQCAEFSACAEACSFDSCRESCRLAHPGGALRHAPLDRCLCEICADSCSGRCQASGAAVSEGPTDTPAPADAGCSVGGRGSPWWLLVAIGSTAALTLRRRRGRLVDA